MTFWPIARCANERSIRASRSSLRRLLAQASGKLKEQGVILLELDPEQMPAVAVLTAQHLPEATTSIEQDLARLDRVFVINWGGEPE